MDEQELVSEWKCPEGHPIEMVNEGYGICQAKPHRQPWSAWSFNGDKFGISFPNFPIQGMTSFVSHNMETREEAIEFIRSRRPQSTLVALPLPKELEPAHG